MEQNSRKQKIMNMENAENQLVTYPFLCDMTLLLRLLPCVDFSILGQKFIFVLANGADIEEIRLAFSGFGQTYLR